MQYDIAVIGAGPGGYVAAIRANQLGLKSVVIEKADVGGVCLNWGCIPTKTLIHLAEIINHVPALKHMGVQVDKSKFDYKKVYDASRTASNTLKRGVAGLLKKNKVDYISGTAVIKSAQKVSVDSQSIDTKNIIVATGSSARELPGFEFDEKQVLSSTGMLAMTELPKSLIVMGAGAIGMEFAYVMNCFGVHVTLIEMLPQVLPLEDLEVSTLVENSFKKSGIVIHTSTEAKKLTKSNKGVSLEIVDSLGKNTILKADKILVAVGRVANTKNLGLDKLGVKTERGFIPVEDYYQTTVKGVYAIGDVVWGTPLLAHVASKEGEIAVEHIAGRTHQKNINPLNIPSGVYSNPQVGSFGLTESKAKEKKIDFKKAFFPFAGVGKAVAVGESEGFIKIITDRKTGEILGAHAVGNNATEIIHELLLARSSELLTSDIATMIHAHPTIFEGVMEAARASDGWAIHI